jgi:hypothetical protein
MSNDTTFEAFLIKVAADSRPTAVAGAIAGAMRERRPVGAQAICQEPGRQPLCAYCPPPRSARGRYTVHRWHMVSGPSAAHSRCHSA